MDDTEWDTMLFFFGIIFCISGLSYLGYLEVASGYLYEGFGPGPVNTLIGIFSAGFDNIPIDVCGPEHETRDGPVPLAALNSDFRGRWELASPLVPPPVWP
jgi:hypothetical protein